MICEVPTVIVCGGDSMLLDFVGVRSLIDAGAEPNPVAKLVPQIDHVLNSAPTTLFTTNYLQQNESRIIPIVGNVVGGEIKKKLKDQGFGPVVLKQSPAFDANLIYKSNRDGRLEIIVLDGGLKPSIDAMQKAAEKGDLEAIDGLAKKQGMILALVWYPAKETDMVKRILYTGNASTERVVAALEKASSLTIFMVRTVSSGQAAAGIKLPPRVRPSMTASRSSMGGTTTSRAATPSKSIVTGRLSVGAKPANSGRAVPKSTATARSSLGARAAPSASSTARRPPVAIPSTSKPPAPQTKRLPPPGAKKPLAAVVQPDATKSNEEKDKKPDAAKQQPPPAVVVPKEEPISPIAREIPLITLTDSPFVPVIPVITLDTTQNESFAEPAEAALVEQEIEDSSPSQPPAVLNTVPEVRVIAATPEPVDAAPENHDLVADVVVKEETAPIEQGVEDNSASPTEANTEVDSPAISATLEAAPMENCLLEGDVEPRLNLSTPSPLSVVEITYNPDETVKAASPIPPEANDETISAASVQPEANDDLPSEGEPSNSKDVSIEMVVEEGFDMNRLLEVVNADVDVVQQPQEERADGGNEWNAVEAGAPAGILAMTLVKKNASPAPRLSKERYFELVAVPHNGKRTFLTSMEQARDFFSSVRSANYVVESEELPAAVLEGWLEGKRSWRQPDAPSTIIPSTTTPVIEEFKTQNAAALEEQKMKIVVAIDQSKITIEENEVNAKKITI